MREGIRQKYGIEKKKDKKGAKSAAASVVEVS